MYYLNCFFILSFIGHLIETYIVKSNSGILLGWWTPVYGIGTIIIILINNFMSEPVWWEDNYLGTLGFFHPEKWKILISFDEAFATYGDLKYEYNNEGKTFVSQLSAYLSNFVIIDEATGMRVTMSGLEPIE